jgi:apolipoprotein N-acyltransferase
LIVLPETALPRMIQEIPMGYMQQLAGFARAHGGNLVIGVPTAESSTAYYNSAISIGSNAVQQYDKSHLVPFGEFIPYGFRWFVDMMKIPLGDFSYRSHVQAPLQLNQVRAAVNICYEDLFGDEIIRQLPQANLLINISNIAWFGASLAPHQHLQISRMRALETGRYMLRATNTGATAVIDARGNVTAQLPLFTLGSLQASVQPYEGATPYVRWGDWPAVLLSVLLLAWGARRAWRSRPAAPPV